MDKEQRDLDVVERALAREDAAVGKATATDAWRIGLKVLYWLVIGLVFFAVLRLFWH